jgi:hypothetical protein
MLAVEYVHGTGGHGQLQTYMEGKGYDTLLKMQRDDGGVNDLILSMVVLFNANIKE